MGTTYQWSAPRGIGFPGPGLAVSDRLAVAANQDGHLEAFAVGNDGGVWHSWQDLQQDTWSGWATLGTPPGAQLNGPGTTIQVLQNADGRLEVFIADNQWNVWHIWQVAANANWVAGWNSLGKPQGVNASSSFSMVVTSNEVEELEVFLKDDDTGQIFSRSQTVKNGGWEPVWTNLGTPPSTGGFPPVRDFVVAGPNSTLTIQVIALGSDGSLYHATRSRFIVGGGAWSAWSKISSGPAGASLDWLPTVRENQDRHLELFAFAPPNLWHTWQSNPELWSGAWDNFGAPPGGSDDTVDVHLDQGGMLNIVSWGNNPVEIFQLHQTAPNNGWTGWSILREGANPNEFGSPTLILVPSPNGLLNLFSRGLGNQIYYIPQIVLKG